MPGSESPASRLALELLGESLKPKRELMHSASCGEKPRRLSVLAQKSANSAATTPSCPRTWRRHARTPKMKRFRAPDLRHRPRLLGEPSMQPGWPPMSTPSSPGSSQSMKSSPSSASSSMTGLCAFSEAWPEVRLQPASRSAMSLRVRCAASSRSRSRASSAWAEVLPPGPWSSPGSASAWVVDACGSGLLAAGLAPPNTSVSRRSSLTHARLKTSMMRSSAPKASGPVPEVLSSRASSEFTAVA
mmetsp:Transcript_23729/g.74692  ORF Transcript_23729/g.74692 Transcript_23729/m.74692 type:complete len:245 (-) Transcript_23729:860-1594(-)